MEVLKKKQNILLSLLFSVIGVGVIVALLANILFAEIYKNNKSMFTGLCLALLILILLLLGFLIYRYDNVVFKTKLPLIFNLNEKRFDDLPYSPPSVRARVLFDNLSKKQKDAIRNNDKELFDFCNSFVVQDIFSLVFYNTARRSSISNWIPVNREYLKDLLVNYKYIDIDEMICTRSTGRALELPYGFKIKSVDNNTVTISTNQGFIKLSWEIKMRTPCTDELFFLAQLHNKDISHYMAIFAELKLEYGYKPLKVFFKSTQELDNYLEMCMELLTEYDIKTITERARIITLTEVIKKLEINTYKEILQAIENLGYKK